MYMFTQTYCKTLFLRNSLQSIVFGSTVQVSGRTQVGMPVQTSIGTSAGWRLDRPSDRWWPCLRACCREFLLQWCNVVIASFIRAVTLS